jgi:hypothetical protein
MQEKDVHTLAQSTWQNVHKKLLRSTSKNSAIMVEFHVIIHMIVPSLHLHKSTEWSSFFYYFKLLNELLLFTQKFILFNSSTSFFRFDLIFDWWWNQRVTIAFANNMVVTALWMVRRTSPWRRHWCWFNLIWFTCISEVKILGIYFL